MSNRAVDTSARVTKPAERSDAAGEWHDTVPAVRGGIVARPRLFERLAEAARVTQVSAPAGSGKTYLLRSWIAEFGRGDNAAWVPVQAGEQDPQRFWIAVLDALRDTIAGSELVRPLTGAPDLDGWTVVEHLLEDLEPLEDSLWLVIDDVYELGSAEALAQLELLVMRAPADLRFVLLTRGDVRLALHRLRVEGELTEIRASDLQFSIDEARALFEAAGVELSSSAMAALVRRTEGWAAGLRLAALSLAGRPDPDRFAAEFSGSERTVAEYLMAEVLDHQSEQVRRLLLRTSVCEQISGELADLLTGETGGERILQDLEEAGAFVVSLDSGRSWFRYHQLFADLLQLELRRSEPTGPAALHGVAARWYARNGDLVEAVRQAQAAREWSLAARLLADEFLGLALDGRAATTHELLAGFPAVVVAADPEVAVSMAADELFRQSPEAAERHLARAEREMMSVPAHRTGRFQENLAMMRLMLAQRRGDLPAVAEEAQRVLARAGPADAAHPTFDEDTRALALVTLGTAELWALRAAEAERHLDQGSTLARRIGRPWLEVGALAHGGWAASSRSFAVAAERFTRAIELAREHGWSEEPVVAPAYAGLGAIRVWQMRLEEAEALLKQAEHADRGDAEPAAVVLHQARGMLALARGHDGQALAAFEAAERLAGLLVAAHPCSTPMRAHMLQTLIRLGEAGRAEQALAEVDEIGPGEMRNALAALRLAQGDPRAATAELAPALNGSAPAADLGWASQAFWLEAIACDALGDAMAAGRALEQALDLAEPDRAVFAFVLHPAPELLQRHARRGTSHAALISDILGLLAGNEPAGTKPAWSRGEPGQLHEPLSPSEIRVLRFLPSNLPVSELATHLFLSVHTVRTHMRHIYEKLGTHSRLETVEKARTLGILTRSSAAIAPPRRNVIAYRHAERNPLLIGQPEAGTPQLHTTMTKPDREQPAWQCRSGISA